MHIRNSLFCCILLSTTIFSCTKDAVSTSNPGDAAVAYSQTNVGYGGEALQKMDVYLPAGRTTSTTKVMILIHGGAWSSGDKLDFAAYVDTMKRRQPGYAIFNINYRLSVSGTNTFPAQELDTKAAIEYIYSKKDEYKISDKFVLLGASAGAHLSLLHAYKYPAPVKIKAVVDFFGPTDMNDMYTNAGLFQLSIFQIVGATPATNATLYQQSSPINFITSNSACPTIILQGDADPLVNDVRQSAPLYARLQAANVPVQYNLYPGKDHGANWGNDTYFNAFNKIDVFLSLHNP
jgi:acetyl esterase/lipase